MAHAGSSFFTVADRPQPPDLGPGQVPPSSGSEASTTSQQMVTYAIHWSGLSRTTRQPSSST